MPFVARITVLAALFALSLLPAKFATAQSKSPLPWRVIYPEQRTTDVRPLEQLPVVPLPTT